MSSTTTPRNSWGCGKSRLHVGVTGDGFAEGVAEPEKRPFRHGFFPEIREGDLQRDGQPDERKCAAGEAIARYTDAQA